MKASWIKRIYKSDEGWASTPLFYGLDNIYKYGDMFMQKKTSIKNKFWSDVIKSVCDVCKNASIRSIEHILSMPLWYNTQIIPNRLPKWVEMGIITIGNLLDTNGEIYTIEYLNDHLQLNCDFLLYIRLKKRISNIIGNNKISSIDNARPRLPFILYNIEVGQKGNKNIYFNIQTAGQNILIDLKEKWSHILNDEIRLDTLSNSFKNAKKISPSVFQHFIQYKLIHRRIVHNKILYKMGISETPNCLYCGKIETIEHVYLECPNVLNLWQESEIWVKSLHYPHFKISENEKIFGEKYNDHIKHVVITSIKDVIYQKRKKGDKMNLSDVKKSILRNLHIRKSKETLLDGISNFDEDWKPFIDTLRVDQATRSSWYRI